MRKTVTHFGIFADSAMDSANCLAASPLKALSTSAKVVSAKVLIWADVPRS
ncbi:hypothetical protein [Dyadobacter bucti]|uniref:hypothetical protein n=1 Tax=Dyadobacter bucti TaxID=2572203 RepID=UPI0014075778|nr:hypothetical protein [Dyadobacter bucti]